MRKTLTTIAATLILMSCKAPKTRNITDHIVTLSDSSKIMTCKLTIKQLDCGIYLTINQVEKLRKGKLNDSLFNKICDSIEGGTIVFIKSVTPLKDTVYTDN